MMKKTRKGKERLEKIKKNNIYLQEAGLEFWEGVEVSVTHGFSDVEGMAVVGTVVIVVRPAI